MKSTAHVFWSWAKGFFSVKEWMVFTLSVLLSTIIITSVYVSGPVAETLVPYSILGSNIAIRNANDERLAPFYSIFFTAYEAQASQGDKDEVLATVTDLVPLLHAYADRHHLFYIDRTQPELGYLNNLFRLNLSLGSSIPLEIDYPFYKMLALSLHMVELTHGYFNPFLGTISDFWDEVLANPFYPLEYRDLDPTFHPIVRRELEHKLSFIPRTVDEINETLELTEENGKYFARLHAFHQAQVGDIKMSLGAIAKGFANDYLADILTEKNLTEGYLFNGSSSITAIGPRYGNRPYTWSVESPIPSVETAFEIERAGRHSLSTSGAYGGRTIRVGSQKVLRHHILNPFTGYPSQTSIELNVMSASFPAGGLDALSTAMMIMSKEEAMEIRSQILEDGDDLECAWIEIENDDLMVTTSPGYTPYLNQTMDVKYSVLS
jgi:thiamine biosynthesis lipoprotein ApbE